jgi:hypothetical protein
LLVDHPRQLCLRVQGRVRGGETLCHKISGQGAECFLIATLEWRGVRHERARKALRGWRSYVISIISAGIKAWEIRPGVDARKLATLIISSLEGAIMLYRLERNPEALRAVKAHLDRYLETEARLPAK